ncbi:MAG: hypothetical protein V2A73_07370, partial [Pseudomonadota bacterium]
MTIPLPSTAGHRRSQSQTGPARQVLVDGRSIPWLLVLASVVLTAYWPALRGEFLNWDDNRFITENPLFEAGGWTYVSAALTTIQLEAYQPLHLLSYLPDRYLWPSSPSGFHALNVALFLGSLSLLFTLATRHATSRCAAFAACLLYALHPLLVEPVAWITARKDLLALVLFLASIALEDGAASAASPGHESRWRRLVSPLLAAMAALTKTATICLPLVLAAWLYWLRRLPGRRVLVRVIPHAAVSVVVAPVVMLLWHQNELIRWSRPNPWPVDVASTIATYLGRTIWPTNLAAIYPEQPSFPMASSILLLSAALLLLLFWKRLPCVARFAVAGSVAALLPVANLVPVYFRFADRYALLALTVLVVPFAMLASWLQACWQRRGSTATETATETETAKRAKYGGAALLG